MGRAVRGKHVLCEPLALRQAKGARGGPVPAHAPGTTPILLDFGHLDLVQRGLYPPQPLRFGGGRGAVLGLVAAAGARLL